MTVATCQSANHDDQPLDEKGRLPAPDPQAPAKTALQDKPRSPPTWYGARASTGTAGDAGWTSAGDADDELLDNDDVDAVHETEPGHYVMDRAAIKAALKASGFEGSYEALSSGEEVRVRTLVTLQHSDLWRPHVIGAPAMLDALDALAAEQANFANVIEVVRKAVYLSMIAGTAIRIPPLLVVGSPGIGKSRFARGLAQCLGSDLNTINGSTIPDVGSITGYTPVWRGASQGRVSKFVIAARNSSPICFVDESDKLQSYEVTENIKYPLDKCLSLLESSTASEFNDEYLQVPMRCQHAIFLFACNSLENLSAPFLDRVLVFRIDDLDRDQRDTVLETMLKEVTPAGLTISIANRAALEPLHDLGLRRARLALEIAITIAVADNRRFIAKRDLIAAVALLERPQESRRVIGFFQPRG